MSRRYDKHTTTFTPDGRLMQVEYAIEAINKTSSSIGILTSEGIILITSKEDLSILLEQSKLSEKTYRLNQNIYCMISGLAADGNYLIDKARVICSQYKYTYNENMPVEQLIIRLCDIKQNYTQFGGLRPFGAAFLFAGYDKLYGFQLYSSDPSGNYSGWKATAIGQHNLAANSLLKEHFEEGMSLQAGLDLAVKALSKTIDSTNPSPNKIEIMTITLDDNKEIKGEFLSEDQKIELLKRNKLTSTEEQK